MQPRAPLWLSWINGTSIVLFLVAPLGGLIWNAVFGAHAGVAGSGGSLSGTEQAILFGRSLGLSICSGILGTLCGIIGGYAAARQSSRIQQRFVAAMVLPLLVPPFVLAISWIILWRSLGFSFFGFWASSLVLGLSFWPIAGLLVWAGLSQAPRSLLEVAQFGPSPSKVFFRIELGLIRPHLVTAFLVIALFSFSDYAVPSFLRVNTYPVFVFAQFAAFLDLRSGVIMCWPYVILPVCAILIWRRRMGARLFEGEWQRSLPSSCNSARIWHLGWTAGYYALMMISLVVPLAILLKSAGPWDTYIKAWNSGYRQLAVGALVVGTAATIMSMSGFLLAAYTLWRKGPWRMLADFASLLPIALPGTLFGLGLIFLWNRPATQFVYGTMIILMLLCISRFWGFAIRTQWAGIGRIPRNLVEAAQFGDARFGTFLWRIIVPQAAPSILAGWVMGSLLSLHELSGTLLVSPPGIETLAVRIYSAYHYGAGDLLAALSLLLVALGVLILVTAVALFTWTQRHWPLRV